MTRNTKIWAAIVAVATALAIATVFAATSPRARVRFWAWRMHSGDREVRAKARVHLLEIGRPSIDPVYADVVAGEMADRSAETAFELILVPVDPKDGSYWFGRSQELVVSKSFDHGRRDRPRVPLPRLEDDRSWDMLRKPDHPRRRLILADEFGDVLLDVALPLDESLAEATIETTRARLGPSR